MQNSIVRYILVELYSRILRDRRSEACTLDYQCPRPRTRTQTVSSILGSTMRPALHPCHQQQLRSPTLLLQSQPAQRRRWCKVVRDYISVVQLMLSMWMRDSVVVIEIFAVCQLFFFTEVWECMRTGVPRKRHSDAAVSKYLKLPCIIVDASNPVKAVPKVHCAASGSMNQYWHS